MSFTYAGHGITRMVDFFAYRFLNDDDDRFESHDALIAVRRYILKPIHHVRWMLNVTWEIETVRLAAVTTHRRSFVTPR